MPDLGIVVDEVEFPVEQGKLREFAHATGAADGNGMPLTFTAVAGHWRDQAAMVKLLGLDLRRIVVGGAEWEYHAPIRAGDRLRGQRVLVAREQKKEMTLFTLETRFHRQDGELAVIQRDTVIELPRR
jgi:acyl dehydratase